MGGWVQIVRRWRGSNGTTQAADSVDLGRVLPVVLCDRIDLVDFQMACGWLDGSLK